MAYTKQTWADLPSKTTPINASRLGHIEQGIYDAASTADTAASDASSAISGLADKVDKVEGKGLSTNDYDDTAKGIVDTVTANLSMKVDKSDVARVEDGTSPSATINADEQFYHSGILYTATADIATTDTITPNTNCRVSDSVTEQIAEQEQLLEDTVGWLSDNRWSDSIYKNNTAYNSSGDEISNEQFKLYKCIVGSEQYHFKSTNSTGIYLRIKYFDISDTVLDFTSISLNANANIIITCPTNTAYIIVSIRNDVTNIKLTHVSVDEQKSDNSVIAPVENGSTASQAYAVNDVFIRNRALCKVTSAISQGDTLSNQFTETNVGAILTALLNA